MSASNPPTPPRPNVFGEGRAGRERVGKRILVAGIGNAWMRDDAFGGKVAERLERVELPDGPAVFDFGIGGIDLAYEVMRGYSALVLVDVSRQGGEPGTLYVMDADPEDIEPIGDGEVVSPHGMDPQTVLRFVKTVGGWPGKVVVIACEPGSRRGDGAGTLPARSRRRSPARSDLVLETVRRAAHRRGLHRAAGGAGRCMSSRSPRRSSTRRSGTPAVGGSASSTCDWGSCGRSSPTRSLLLRDRRP